MLHDANLHLPSSVCAIVLCLGAKRYYRFTVTLLARSVPKGLPVRRGWHWHDSRAPIGCAERERERKQSQDRALSLTSCSLSLRSEWRGGSLRPWQTLDRKLSPASPFDCPWTSAWPSHQECVAAVCCKCLHRVNSGLCTGPGLMNWANSNQVAWDTRLRCITLLRGWQASAGG